ncbi:MAG: type II toxin-antitoxin system PemK/MazF family toxin [Myxococcota bacterium]
MGVLDTLWQALRQAFAPPAPPRPLLDPRRGEVATADARPVVAYAPVRDGDADPGEIVWAYVPFEDDPTRGKDRPLLVIGHLGDDVAALQLTSRPHDDRHHYALGAGEWDAEARPSWVKLDRVVRLDPDAIRREGAVLDRPRFDRAVAAWRAY